MILRTINPGGVYMLNGSLCMVTHVDQTNKQAHVIFDDGSTGMRPLHQIHDGVPYGIREEYLLALLSALRAIAADCDPEPLYDDATMQKAHRTGMLLGALSTCDDILARLSQVAKTDGATAQDAMQAVEAYVAGVHHLGVRDGIATETDHAETPTNQGVEN